MRHHSSLTCLLINGKEEDADYKVAEEEAKVDHNVQKKNLTVVSPLCLACKYLFCVHI